MATLDPNARSICPVIQGLDVTLHNNSNEILVYLQRTLPERSKSKAQQLVSPLTHNLHEVCKDWLAYLRANQTDATFTTTLLKKRGVVDVLHPEQLENDFLISDREGMLLLAKIFQETYQIKCKIDALYPDCEKLFRESGANKLQHSLLEELPTFGWIHNVSFFWDPQNSHVRSVKEVDENTLQEFRPHMRAYLEKNLDEEMISQIEEFVPHLAERINHVCKEWLEVVRSVASESTTECELIRNLQINIWDREQVENTFFVVDQEAIKLITLVFERTYGIGCQISTYSPKTEKLHRNLGGNELTNSLLNVLPKTGWIYNVKFNWSNFNEHVYGW